MELGGIFTKFKKRDKKMKLGDICERMLNSEYDFACFWDKSRKNDLYRPMTQNSFYPPKSLWFTEILRPGRFGKNEPRNFEPWAKYNADYVNSGNLETGYDMSTWDIQFIESRYLRLSILLSPREVEKQITYYYLRIMGRGQEINSIVNADTKDEAINWYTTQGNMDLIWGWLADQGWAGIFMGNARNRQDQGLDARLWSEWDDNTLAIWKETVFEAYPQKFKNCGPYEYEYSFWCPPG
jgi:hypothetical protein